MRCSTFQTFMKVCSIGSILDCGDIASVGGDSVGFNEVASVRIALDRPMACEKVAEQAQLRRFVIVDGYDVCGGGIILDALGDGEAFGTAERGAVFLLTGLSGAGKTTLGRIAADKLKQSGKKAFLIDGDEIRHTLNADLGYSRADRIENIRRIAHVANMLKNEGFAVLVSMIAPYREGRKLLSDIVGNDYYEVYVRASLETCIARDVKGYYKRALNNEIDNFTGISDGYEVPADSDLTIDTENADPDMSGELLVSFINSI